MIERRIGDPSKLSSYSVEKVVDEWQLGTCLRKRGSGSVLDAA